MMPNKPTPGNAGWASRFQFEHPWPGVPESSRSATANRVVNTMHVASPVGERVGCFILELALAVCVGGSLAGCRTPKEDQSLAPISPIEHPTHRLQIDLPSFKTFEELKTYGNPREGVERYYRFQDQTAQVAVIVVGWGSGDVRDGIFVYIYNHLTDVWDPVALWSTQARGVKVEFDKRLGTIHVSSAKGIPIFSANIRALSPKRLSDW